MATVRRLAVATLLCLLATGAALASHSSPDPEMLAGLKARSIGPATMSGRIASIDAVESNPDVIYVGAATGGVWKSMDGGVTWKPIFDNEKVAAIGAVAVFQANPDVVWVGTGEGNPRNSASVGYGVWKSLDGGATWTHLGLEKTERIHRIVLDPTDPDVAYVAAMGRMWGENEERGVFKTTDGGATWHKVLYVDERTGCADLVGDPSNPDKLFAAMWDYRRWPWSFRSGGPGSGLYVTYDGGATWKRFTDADGLPEGELGRIGIGICRAHPEVVYALVEAEKNALLRSDDGGRSWRKVSEGGRVASRPFYYADIYVDPVWPNRVYDLASRLTVSDDGGTSFEGIAPFRSVHSDYHAMWINPSEPSHVIVGNDGGVAVSFDRGATWRYVPNLPLAQYYHVNVDSDTPYHVYGGLQDNGSWRGPSSVWENGEIRNHHWQEVGFGDGFDVLPDPTDSMQGYSMSQEGYLRRWNLRTGEQKDIRPAASGDVPLRFNWNAAIAQDPFDEATLYFGSQFVHRSTDRGDSWVVISPDLTSNNPEWQKQASSGGLTLDVTGAENFTTIVTIAPSPVARGVIWVGTDDGRLHVTRDGGSTWASLENKLKGVPKNTWIPHVEASKHDAGTAYVVCDDHRRSNWTPYVFKTTDYGATWKSLATRDLWGYCLVVEEDPVDPQLLFLGTEFGLWISQDGGGSWWRFTHGLPTVSVMDLVVQPQEHDLVIATHGRALYIVDDIRPLRSVSAEILAEPIHLFDIPPAQQYRVRQTGGERFAGDTEFRGENQPYGALITFSLADANLPHPNPEKERARKEALASTTVAKPAAESTNEGRRGRRNHGPRATITVAGTNGAVVRTFKAPVTQGLNRAVWDLSRDEFKSPPRGERDWWGQGGGPEVLPSTYTVTVKLGESEASGSVEVLADPRFEISRSDREAKWRAILRAGALQETFTEAIRRLREVRDDTKVVERKLRTDDESEEDPSIEALLKQAKALAARVDEVEKLFWVPPGTKGIVDLGDARGKIRRALGALQSSWDAPTPAQLGYLTEAEATLAKALESLANLFEKDVASFRTKVLEAKVELFLIPEPLGMPSAQD